ncbi:MAG: FAD-dependent oxidoreductase [Hyphomicrobiaceae bacterium]
MSAQTGARIVIVGGGIIGLSIAYHLARRGERDVLLLERNSVTSGTSWHAAGIVGPLRASMNLTKLAIYATELFPRLETETGQSTGYRQTGGFWLARTPERMEELERIAAMGEMTGLHPHILTPPAVRERLPLLNVADLAGALWVDEDGQANPVDICMAYQKGAKAGGVRIEEGAKVTGFSRAGGRVTGVDLADGRHIAAEKVVLAGGAWSRDLGALAGVPVPLQAVEHMYIVTEPVPGLPQPFPIIRDLEGRIYIKEDAGRLVMGGFEPDAKIWDAAGPDGDRPFLELPQDWQQFEPFMEAGLARMPVLAEVGVQHFMNGPESFTPDTAQAMGESPFLRNFFVAAGFNSIGMMSSAGVGRVMAEWVATGEAPMDLWGVDIARFDRASASPRFLAARVKEAVETQFAMHWPYKQKTSARDLRRTPLHEAFAAAGAVFGAPTGIERPLWFAAREAEREVAYSYGAQGWWPMAERECLAIRDRVALIELSPFTKIDVTGTDALAFLQTLASADLDVVPGRVVYTPMLNARGGVELDVTVTRVGETLFRITSGAATRWRDLAYLRRAAEDRGLAVSIHDATSAEAVIGVMGPGSRQLLQSLSSAGLANAAFPFQTARQIDVGPVAVMATRVSFVGELGYELTVAAESAHALHRALVEAGGAFGLAHAGHYALDACRIEKGYGHWSHEIGPEDGPLEAGLGFAVAWEKHGGFVGREALLRQREAGLRRRLAILSVEADEPVLLLHDEPVYRDGRLAGRTTSGARGFRTGLSLAIATIDTAPGAARSALAEGRYEIGVAGRRLPARIHLKPPYDPEGLRLRG